MVGKVKLGFLDACVCKAIYIKEKLDQKLNIFYWRFALIKQVFARTLTTLGFRYLIISVKLLLFRANVLLDANTKILLMTELSK